MTIDNIALAVSIAALVFSVAVIVQSYMDR
jgi:hypothetical protein